MSEHPTAATGGLRLLATPTAWLGRRGSHAQGQAERWHDPARSNELSDQMASLPLLPTPAEADGDRTSDTYGRGNPTLSGAVRLLPTPTEGDSRNSRNSTANGGQGSTGNPGTTLSDVAYEWSGASTSSLSADGKPSTDQRPRLSPEFVEWMMGAPSCTVCGLGWTDVACPHSAMEFTSTSAGSSETR